MTEEKAYTTNLTINRDWAQVPEHIQIENCHELVRSKDGRIFLSVDHPANNILVFSLNGDFITDWTLGYDGCHGLTLFEHNDVEYLLITQTGMIEHNGIVKKGLGEVVKTTLDGEVPHTFSNPFELGLYRDPLTYNPTETCVAPNGNIYVADGYGASYIHCFTQDGAYQFSFGGSEKAPSDSSLINPHGIAIDPRFTDTKGDPLLVISSRKQSRFKHFTLSGEFVDETYLPGIYPCRAAILGEYLYAGVCWSGPVVSNDAMTNYVNRLDESGFVIILNKQGEVVTTIGSAMLEYTNKDLHPKQAQADSLFIHVHDVLPIDEKTLLISQWRAHQSLPYQIKCHSKKFDITKKEN
ncbi:hypothetical protein AB2S62_05915 [Vibrio sp. NTOU-M3]|uniref:hypothetical protein n=1 Tax=Vibrio sp. NTOU-M3 TaxID=3234954 RepID=UPI00349FA799